MDEARQSKKDDAEQEPPPLGAESVKPTDQPTDQYAVVEKKKKGRPSKPKK